MPMFFYSRLKTSRGLITGKRRPAILVWYQAHAWTTPHAPGRIHTPAIFVPASFNPHISQVSEERDSDETAQNLLPQGKMKIAQLSVSGGVKM